MRYLQSPPEMRGARSATDVNASFAIVGFADAVMRGLLGELVDALAKAGFAPAESGTDAGLVINVVDPAAPKPFRRRSKGTFVAALWTKDEPPEDGLRETYPMLVRAHRDRQESHGDSRPGRAAPASPGFHDVTTLVTGATGFLGRHLDHAR